MLPGAPTQILVRTRLEDETDEVSLAGSAEALAVAVNAANEGFGGSRVLIGPPAGPLREVARCRAGVLVPPVAVAGSQIAWRDGGCARPARNPNAIGPATIAIANVDPLLPARRISVPGKGLPASLVLAAGDTGLVGLLLPQPNDELSARIRPFAPTAIGAPIAARQSGYLLALGILGDGAHGLRRDPQLEGLHLRRVRDRAGFGQAARRGVRRMPGPVGPPRRGDRRGPAGRSDRGEPPNRVAIPGGQPLRSSACAAMAAIVASWRVAPSARRSASPPRAIASRGGSRAALVAARSWCEGPGSPKPR